MAFEPDKRGGKPCIRGLRITVYDLLGYLASGMTEDEILNYVPHLPRDDVRACIRAPRSAHVDEVDPGGEGRPAVSNR